MTISEFKKLPFIEGFELVDYKITFICTIYEIENIGSKRWERDIQQNYDNNWDSEDCKVHGLTYQQYLDNYADLSANLDFVLDITDKYGIFFTDDISTFGTTVKIKNFNSYVADEALLSGLDIVNLNFRTHTLEVQIDDFNNSAEELKAAIFRH